MQESADLKDFLTQRSEKLGPEKCWSRVDGVLLIGSDPTEWAEGYDNIVPWLTAEADDSDTTRVLGDKLRAFSEGTVGWARTDFKWRLKDGTEIPGRWTAVCRKEGDEWTFVQAHVSIGVPNEEVFS